MLKLARPSVIILLHQKGPGPALSRERPRSLTFPPPEEAPSPRAGLARTPVPAPLLLLSLPESPSPGRAAGVAGFLSAPRGWRAGRLGDLRHLLLETWGKERGSSVPTCPGPNPHSLLPCPVLNPHPFPLRYLVSRPSPWLARMGESDFCREHMGNRLSAPPSWVGFRLELAYRSRKPERKGCTGEPGRCDPFYPPALPFLPA